MPGSDGPSSGENTEERENDDGSVMSIAEKLAKMRTETARIFRLLLRSFDENV